MAQRELAKKICLLGDGAVGKTSLIRKFVFDNFDDKYIQTIGAKVTKKTLEFTPEDGVPTKLSLMIYDILGQKDFIKLHKAYYLGTHGALVVCDSSRPDTLTSLDVWKESLFDAVGKVPLVFLGNKVDLIDDRTQIMEQLGQHAMPMSSEFFLTSAKTGENVEEAFNALGRKLC